TYLLWRYPIKSVNGNHRMPTCPYRWPNGQGDVGKFLEGEKNNDIWRQRYGGIYRVWSGMNSERMLIFQPYRVLTRPEDIQNVFADSDKHTKATNNNSGWLMGELLGKCVGLVSHSEWKSLRSITETPFLPNNMGSYIELIERKTKRHFDDLFANGSLGQGILNPVEDLKLLPFWIVAEILYGELSVEMQQTLENLIPLRESLFRRIIGGGLTRFWWSRYLPISAIADLAKFKMEWSNFNDLAYQNAERQSSRLPISYFYQEIESGSMTRQGMLQTLDEILFANLDVTMGGISWIFMFLGAYPELQTELRQEVISHTSSESGKESEERYYLSKSTLLAASILESSRLKPLAAFSIPQATPTDRIVGDFVIPAGTNFIVDSYALNTYNAYWGKDNTEFRPDRFLERTAIKSRYNLWRFGFGPRNCMGKYLADTMIRVLFAYIVENCQISLITGKTSWKRNEKTWIMHPDTVLICERLHNNEHLSK
ncbi:Cytochrome P450 monooxygenase, partial [Lachnellula willkommii]